MSSCAMERGERNRRDRDARPTAPTNPCVPCLPTGSVMTARRGPATATQPVSRARRILRALGRRIGALVAFGFTAAGVLAIAAITSRHQLAQPDDERFPVRGIDVSHHQGAIDWPAVAGSGIRFAFIKATEGTDHNDTRFAFNWQASAAVGIQRGAYHYFTFCSPGRAQAAHLVRTVPPGQPMLPPAVDVEYYGNCANPPSNEVILRELGALLEALTAAYGRKPILYTTNEARLRLLGRAFHEYPMWIRNVYAPPWSLGVTGWTFWQHNDEGELPGVRTPVDLNVFHGDMEGLVRCGSVGECVPVVEVGAGAGAGAGAE